MFKRRLKDLVILLNNPKCFSSSPEKSPIISCKMKHLNFYGQPYKKDEEISLASKNWDHKKSKGDYFIIHRGALNKEYVKFESSNFHSTGLSDYVIQAAERLNILVPTSIQSRSIPQILNKINLLITAETGCGKTLAYLLPIFDQILSWKSIDRKGNSPLVIILTPGRELVNQIYNVAKEYCKLIGIDVRQLVGGYTKKKLMNVVHQNVDIVVATPGIFSKFLTHGMISPQHVRHVVLDEADTILDESFEFKMSGILSKIKFMQRPSDSNGAQLSLVSATVPSDLSSHIAMFVNPLSVKNIISEESHKTLPNLPQRFLRIGVNQKPIELLKIVRNDVNQRNPLMIFSNKTSTCDWITHLLNNNDIKCVSVNGDMPVAIRNGKYAQFDDGEVDVISCTDLLSRGMDTTRTKHVLNYDFPMNTFDYLHRIGRTGRIGSSRSCRVTNFVSRLNEIMLVQRIEMSVRKLADLPSIDGNIKKAMRIRSGNQIERARRELSSLKDKMAVRM